MAKQSTKSSGKGAPPRSRPGRGGVSRTRYKAQRRKQVRGSRTFWVILAVVIVLGVAGVVATVSGGGSSKSSAGDGAAPAPASLVSKVTGVSDTVSNSVVGGSATLPVSVNAPALTADGKPLVLFMGGEYCPYCAAERWAMVLALSRFGTFSGLQTIKSSSQDVYPSTSTFTFKDVKYSSPYITFQPVEVESNQIDASTGNYKTLQTPTAAQEQVIAKYDAPPYVSGNAGSIPFIDFGGKYLVSGQSYSPAVLQGLSWDDIASKLTNANDPVTQGVVGAANALTASICKMTNNQPTNVCSQPAIQTLMGQLK
jgi:hypothetical protein